MRAKSLPPVELPRSVDNQSVFCPVRMGPVGTQRCHECGFLTRPTVDSTGQLTGFVCSPNRPALLSGASI